MTPETRKLIVGNKITSQYMMTEQESEFSLMFDNIQTRLVHEIIKRFTDEMISKRFKDVVIETDLPFGQTKFNLELFVFNREELNQLIQAIEEGR